MQLELSAGPLTAGFVAGRTSPADGLQSPALPFPPHRPTYRASRVIASEYAHAAPHSREPNLEPRSPQSLRWLADNELLSMQPGCVLPLELFHLVTSSTFVVLGSAEPLLHALTARQIDKPTPMRQSMPRSGPSGVVRRRCHRGMRVLA
jgi:hypothetical protein